MSFHTLSPDTIAHITKRCGRCRGAEKAVGTGFLRLAWFRIVVHHGELL